MQRFVCPMNKILRFVRGGVYTLSASFLLLFNFSCNVGLGESVDTKAPTLNISYPPSSAVIRDSFVFSGTWSDDKGVTSVVVSIVNTQTNSTVKENIYASVSDGSWKVTLNEYDTENGKWELADGTYEVRVTGYDNAGNNSGTLSRTFQIDNTPPVFVISNPGGVKDETSSPSAYGSIFTIEGTIADDHDIDTMDVTVYNKSGEIVSNETYNNEQITSFREEDIQTTGGTSVTIAQSGSSTESYKTRYSTLYTAESGTEEYTCSVRLTDSAYIYQDPVNYPEGNGEGNSTYELYLYDDVYTSLMSTKKGLGLSAGDLKNIINGSVTNEAAKTILESSAVDTEAKNDKTNLYFSLNPNANPTYQVNGFAYDFDENGTIQSAASGNSLSVTVSAGLDGTAIDLDGNDEQASTVKVWLKEYASRPSTVDETYTESAVTSSIASLVTKVKTLENSETDFIQYTAATSDNPVTECDGWKLIYDYGQENSGNSSVSTKTFSVTLPAGLISLNKYYITAVTGSDVDEVDLSQDTVYGFEGNEAGVPPTLSVTAPANNTLLASTNFSFKGTAKLSSSSLYVSRLKASLTVTDQDTNKEIGTYTEEISRSSLDSAFTGSSALASDTSGNWTFTPSLLSGYSDIKAEEKSGKSLLYTLTLEGEASSGHTSTTSSYVQIDTTLPVVTISSITPTVEGYDDTENIYVNETITVKGNIEETNLASVTMQVLVDGTAGEPIELGKVYSFSQSIDTTALTDNASLEVVVTASDTVGNSASYSSKSGSGTTYAALYIKQETDRPVITLNNSSNGSDYTSNAGNISTDTDNLFGTTTNNKLTATVSDDDSIKKITVTVYDEAGNALDDSKVNSVYGLNPFTYTPDKTTYNLTYTLPSEEGVYKICIDAYDYIATDTYSKEKGKGTTGTYFIAVSAGAPSISADSVNTYLTASPSFSGSVSSALATVTPAITSASIGGTAATEEELTAISKKLSVTKDSDSTSWKVSMAEGESLSNGQYVIMFTASNSYGETGSVKAEFTVDDTAPTVKITEYNSLASENENGYITTQKFYLNPANIKTIKGSCADNDSGSGVEGVYYFVGDITGKETPSTANGWTAANLTKSTSGTGWTISLADLSVEDSKEYTVHIKAVDNAGNSSADADYITLCIDENGPVFSSAAVTDTSSVTYTKDDVVYSVYGSNSFNVNAVVTDSVSGVSTVTANSTSKLTQNTENTSVYTGTTSATVDSDGFAVISLTASDAVGNTMETTIKNLFIDTTAPVVAVTSYPSSAVKDAFTLKGTVSDNIGDVSGVTVTDSLDETKSYTATVADGEWSVTLTPSATATAENETKDGSHTYTVTATDKVGNKAAVTCSVITDTQAPSWYTGNEDGKAPYIRTTAGTNKMTVEGTEYALYNSTSLSVAAKAKDTVSGVANLLYNLNDETENSVTKWTSADNGNFSIESGIVQGINTLQVKAVDEAGNESSSVSLSFFVDSIAPSEPALKSIDDDSNESSMSAYFAQNTQKLVNGKDDVAFTVAVSDSGESASYSGIASVVLTKIGNTSKNIAGTAGTDDTSVYTVTIPSENLLSGSVTVTVTDNAGNSTSLPVFNLLVDKTAPTVKLTAPSDADSTTALRDVNGTISLSASATDNQSLNESSVAIEYSTGSDNTKTWTALSTDTAGDGFTVVCSDSAITASGIDTTKFTDKSTVYLRAAISDQAGNTGYSSEVELYVNQDSDRPVIKISNLTQLSDGSFILKYGKDAQITGTVTDDDSDDSTVINTLVISESAYTGSETATGTTSFTKATGEFTFTPSDTSDGEKTLFFYIKDNAGNEFYTKDSSSEVTYLKNPKLYCKSDKIEDSAAAAAFTYKSDSTSPQVDNIQGRTSENTAARTSADYSGISVSFIAGGDSHYLQLKITASDANGIDGIMLDVTDASNNVLFKRATAAKIADTEIASSTTESDGNFTVSGSTITATTKYYVNSGDTKTESEDGTTYTWELASLLDLDDVATGALTVTVKAYDKSGLLGNGSQTFMVDNTGPAVTMTSPASTATVSGSSVNVSGTTAEVGSSTVDTIQWLIPTVSQQSSSLSDSDLASLDGWQGELSSTSTATAWTFIFNGNDNALLSTYTKDESYASPDDDGIYALPIYFKAVDLLGNVTICRDYKINYNPDADRPNAEITYPDSSILTDEGYAILGGKIRVTGTVEIPSGDSTAYNVYLQVSDDDGGFDDDDKTKAANTYGFTVIDADALETVWKKDNSATSSLNFSNDSTANKTKKSAWWGIPATLYSSKTSWYIVINEDDKMSVTDDTNNIKIRVCGVGNNGKVGNWSSPYSIHIDSQVPRYSETPLLYQYASGVSLSSGDNFYNAVPAASQSYSSGIYLKGQWYIATSVTDETKVKINSVSLGSSKLSAGSDYFVYPSAAENSSGSAEGSAETDTDDRYIAYVYIKVDKDKTTTQSYTITAQDSDTNGSNTSTATFEVNADNVAPTFAVNSSGKPVLLDGSDSEISMTKLKNSDHVVTFGSSATDTGSGFERVAFYFKRTADGTTTIELPVPFASGSSWTTSTDSAYTGSVSDLSTDTDLTDSVDTNYSNNALYGITLSGTTSVGSDSTTFTANSSISGYKFIRTGGIIKLSGVYYTITGVDSKAITIDGALSSAPVSAFVPAALIVDNTTAEATGTWSSGFVITNDDGDGIVESVKKSGSTWTWDASVFLDELEDGPVTLVAMAFDQAGNVRTLETDVMIANNTPRLAKVYLATDLNGDGKFSDNELGTSLMSDTNETQPFYSALTNGTTGKIQEVVTIENKSGSGITGLTMRGDLGLTFEFVGGSSFEGYGSGNNDLYYKLAVQDSALESPVEGTVSDSEKLTAATESTYDTTADTTTASIVTGGLKGFKITTDAVKTANSDYNEWSYSNVAGETDNNKKNYISVTLWDSTKGTTPGTKDTTDSSGNITAFGSQWTLVNIPLYIDLVDDKFPVPAIADPAAAVSDSVAIGHVDLSGTLPSKHFSLDNSGEYDTDTKISGTVVFTGTVTDETRVNSIMLTTSSSFSSTAVSSKEVAVYNTSTGDFTVTQPAEGLTFAITSNEFSTTDGHTVGWSLTVDTSKVSGIASSDVTFTVAASDGTNTNTADSTEPYAQYQTDIVPYITGIYRSATTNSVVTSTYRSTYGEYAVAVGDTLTVTGFNFASGQATSVGSTAVTANVDTSSSPKSFTMAVPSYSGELTVTVNSIVSLNDKNNNASSNNQETVSSAKNNAKSSTVDGSVLYDNRYLRVWDVGHYFSESTSGNEPTMIADSSGNLFSTWTLMGTGSVMMQRTLSEDSYPIYTGYDQPDKETQIGIDRKSSASGSLSVIFFPANVGSGGTPSSNGYADAQNIGGVWGLGMSNDMDTTALSSQILPYNKGTNASTKEYERYYGTGINSSGTKGKTVKQIRIKGNPFNNLDSTTWTAGWQLASGAMRREVSQFKQGRTARYGDNMHYVYYDPVNKALRYTYQKLTDGVEKEGQYEYQNKISGWILVDGTSDAQDRIHTSSTSYYGVVKAYSGTTVTLNASKSVSAGDTVGIAYLSTSGVYKIVLRTVASSSSGTSVTVKESAPDDISSVTGGAIYTGDSNVVTKGVSRSSSAGSYLSLDVTSSGKPVVVYYDAASEGLRVAYSTSQTPDMTTTSGRDTWTRQTVSGVSGGTYVQAKIDGNNYLHIMYRDSEGKLCYLKSSNNPDGAAYTFDDPMEIDSSGTYGTLSVQYTDGSYVPCVSWLNSEGTANGVKYAVLRDVDTGNAETESLWDVQIVPAVQGNYVSGGELVYVEGKSGSWNAAEDSVNTADCDAVVGYNTGRMDVLFLKTEK